MLRRTSSTARRELSIISVASLPESTRLNIVQEGPIHSVVVQNPDDSLHIGFDDDNLQKIRELAEYRELQEALLAEDSQVNPSSGRFDNRESVAAAGVDILFFLAVLLVEFFKDGAHIHSYYDTKTDHRIEIRYWFKLEDLRLEDVILVIVIDLLGIAGCVRLRLVLISLCTVLIVVATGFLTTQLGLTLWQLWRLLLVGVGVYFRSALVKYTTGPTAAFASPQFGTWQNVRGIGAAEPFLILRDFMALLLLPSRRNTRESQDVERGRMRPRSISLPNGNLGGMHQQAPQGQPWQGASVFNRAFSIFTGQDSNPPMHGDPAAAAPLVLNSTNVGALQPGMYLVSMPNASGEYEVTTISAWQLQMMLSTGAASSSLSRAPVLLSLFPLNMRGDLPYTMMGPNSYADTSANTASNAGDNLQQLRADSGNTDSLGDAPTQSSEEASQQSRAGGPRQLRRQLARKFSDRTIAQVDRILEEVQRENLVEEAQELAGRLRRRTAARHQQASNPGALRIAELSNGESGEESSDSQASTAMILPQPPAMSLGPGASAVDPGCSALSSGPVAAPRRLRHSGSRLAPEERQGATGMDGSNPPSSTPGTGREPPGVSTHPLLGLRTTQYDDDDDGVGAAGAASQLRDGSHRPGQDGMCHSTAVHGAAAAAGGDQQGEFGASNHRPRRHSACMPAADEEPSSNLHAQLFRSNSLAHVDSTLHVFLDEHANTAAPAPDPSAQNAQGNSAPAAKPGSTSRVSSFTRPTLINNIDRLQHLLSTLAGMRLAKKQVADHGAVRPTSR